MGDALSRRSISGWFGLLVLKLNDFPKVSASWLDLAGVCRGSSFEFTAIDERRDSTDYGVSLGMVHDLFLLLEKIDLASTAFEIDAIAGLRSFE